AAHLSGSGASRQRCQSRGALLWRRYYHGQSQPAFPDRRNQMSDVFVFRREGSAHSHGSGRSNQHGIDHQKSSLSDENLSRSGARLFLRRARQLSRSLREGRVGEDQVVFCSALEIAGTLRSSSGGGKKIAFLSLFILIA